MVDHNKAEYGRVMPWFLWKRWVTLTAAHPLVSSQLTHHPLNLLPEYPARPPLVATLESKLTNNDFRSFSSRANTTHWFYYLNILASFLDGSKKIIFKYLWRCVQSLDHIKSWNLWLISGTPYTPWWNINHPLTHPPIQFPYSIPCPPSCSIRARTFASPFYARSQRRRKTWLTAALVSNPPPPLFVTATQPLPLLFTINNHYWKINNKLQEICQFYIPQPSIWWQTIISGNGLATHAFLTDTGIIRPSLQLFNSELKSSVLVNPSSGWVCGCDDRAPWVSVGTVGVISELTQEFCDNAAWESGWQ